MTNPLEQFQSNVAAGVPTAMVFRPTINIDLRTAVWSALHSVPDDEIVAGLAELDDYEIADELRDDLPIAFEAERNDVVAAVANFRSRFMAEQPAKPTLILNIRQAQAVYSAMLALNNVGSRVHAMLDQDHKVHVVEMDHSIEIWAEGGSPVESHTNQAAFAAAYGLDLAAPATPVSDPQLEAVAVANAHLNNAGLPTLCDLNKTLMAGAPQVLDFAPNGKRQDDFRMGWNSAMGRVYDYMRGTVLAQRAINESGE